MPCHFTAAFAAGFCTTLVASPVDVVKTRYMNSVPGQYRGALNCALSMLVNEGPTSFYKGYKTRAKSYWQLSFFWFFFFFSWSFFFFVSRFVPSYLRLGSWNIVMFVTYEQIQRAVMAFQRWQPLLSLLLLRLMQAWTCSSSSGLAGAQTDIRGDSQTLLNLPHDVTAPSPLSCSPLFPFSVNWSLSEMKCNNFCIGKMFAN